jgi:hypothetical protein
MFGKSALLLALFTLPLVALGQAQEWLIERYTELAGSRQNAASLVTGLRDGEQVTLTSATSSKSFTPPTGKMSYGNVDNALTLAAMSLQAKGITQPTPAQLETATMEILRMRVDGKDWAEIVEAKGFKLGDVKRPGPVVRPEKLHRAERPERPERLEKPERFEKPERPQKPERPEKPERSGKGR